MCEHTLQMCVNTYRFCFFRQLGNHLQTEAHLHEKLSKFSLTPTKMPEVQLAILCKHPG